MKRLFAHALLLLTLVGCANSLSELEPESDSIKVKDVVDLQRVGDPAAVLTLNDSSVALVARIPADAAARSVVFTTSAGTFVLTGTKEATIRAQPDSLDALKRLAARIEIRRDTFPFAIVSATFAGYRDTSRVRFR